ncbi:MULTISPECIES: YhcN/YlaJ family sporulation lipoprotein [Metabacillus]|uniref:YhcN/YlaJ family sporulation lipoprotein n=1 Tax=Metabacillus hrfriensis TaxID=3048891 RepID=A0ACD4R878_9BACI|nr:MULTISPECIES: YhcN/YlaJ family sporulation lipoprotein [Metabacillus]UAL51168.1 YhcN/YlaJ family sporulation lipoprotein [Metabacillus dongyingensis]UOK57140.1 YhcN/YlaJ family sporulation lipoprotein [Bacillus sp. OVS6]USK27461.1 YhcN/YlaJ family sporulation lipoprotein [Bacillus sp. CMF21]WHZ56673.1 YhcN/YlaJ family sporulation lipoprotein [Metabacillus sp. CT-WN-B3]
MRHKVTAIAAIAIAATGLAGCNNNEGALDTRYDDSTRPIGYYSDEHRNDNNDVDNVDNDGPLTEMMEGDMNDNYFTKVNNRDDAFHNGRMDNPTAPLSNEDGTLEKDNRFSRTDENYHGQVKQVNYYSDKEEAIAKNVSEKASDVKEVDDVRTVVNGDQVLVAIDTDDKNDKNVKDAVLNAVRPAAKGKEVQVVTDEGTFSRVRTINDNIENGQPKKTIDTDIRDLFDDMGNVMREPFQQAR